MSDVYIGILLTLKKTFTEEQCKKVVAMYENHPLIESAQGILLVDMQVAVEIALSAEKADDAAPGK